MCDPIWTTLLAIASAGCGRIGFDVDSDSQGAGASLIGWWRLDEAAGMTAADSSGYGNDGALTNFDGSAWLPAGGQLGGALLLDGVDAFIDVGKPAVLTVSRFTVALWVKGDADSSTAVLQDVIKKHASDTMDAGTFAFSYSNTASSFQRACSVNTEPGSNWGIAKLTTQLVAGVWNHVACSYDGLVLRAYLNGVEEESTPVASIAIGTSSLFIGARGSNGNTPNGYFAGQLDDVRIYDNALTEAQIRALML